MNINELKYFQFNIKVNQRVVCIVYKCLLKQLIIIRKKNQIGILLVKIQRSIGLSGNGSIRKAT